MSDSVKLADWSYEHMGHKFNVLVAVTVQSDGSGPHLKRRVDKEASTIIEELLKSHPEPVRNSIR